MRDQDLIAYADGSYSVSDVGWYGADQILVSPRPYPVPGFLRLYTNLLEALQETDNTCALQMGPCWFLRPSQVPPRCPGGQPCASMGVPRAADTTGALMGLERAFFRDARQRFVGSPTQFPDSVRRAVQQIFWEPVAQVTSGGDVSFVKDGCVLPIQRKIWYTNQADGRWTRGWPLTYTAAVAASQKIAADSGKTQVVGATSSEDGKIVPVVYVYPGGIVKRCPKERSSEVQVDKMTRFEAQQAFAASRGASLMPWSM